MTDETSFNKTKLCYFSPGINITNFYILNSLAFQGTIVFDNILDKHRTLRYLIWSYMLL